VRPLGQKFGQVGESFRTVAGGQLQHHWPQARSQPLQSVQKGDRRFEVGHQRALMGVAAGNFGAKAESFGGLGRPAIDRGSVGNGVTRRVALDCGEAIAIQSQKIRRSRPRWIKVAHPVSKGPYRTAQIKHHVPPPNSNSFALLVSQGRLADLMAQKSSGEGNAGQPHREKRFVAPEPGPWQDGRQRRP